jgi:PhoH-like ATPase
MKKTYVLDTNVLISDPGSLEAFDNNDVIVPLLVVEELDRLKTRNDDVGRNSREVNRRLSALCDKGDVRLGVRTTSGGTIRISSISSTPRRYLPPEMSTTSVDNMIVEFMLNQTEGTVLVSRDVNIRVKCASLGIKAEDYRRDRVMSKADELYTGVAVVTTNKDEVFDRLRETGIIHAREIPEIDKKMYPNQIVVLKNGNRESQSMISRVRRGSDGTVLKLINKIDDVYGVKPRNKEQIFSLDLLLDPEVKLVTLGGTAGCGKTLLALAAALDQLEGLGSRPLYQKIVVSRPVQPIGKDIGFLPGTLEEKLDPWIAPIRDNLEQLTEKKKTGKGNKPAKGTLSDPYIDIMRENGKIEIEAITFIRGRSIPNSFIIIDESQNLSIHELKTILTRVGDGTKIVLTGDVEQIDNVHVDALTNGLTHAVEKFKDYDIAGHITLIKGERSALATLASQIL